MISQIFVLLVIYQLKHFLADYPLQGAYMLGKFKPGWDFVLPLLAHVGVHGLFTLAIVLWYNPSLWWLSLFDMASHFVMDRVKASPKYLGRFKALSANEFKMLMQMPELSKPQFKSNVYFWWSLGFDQMWHHLTHYIIIWTIVTA
jgi:hypothetical protein